MGFRVLENLTAFFDGRTPATGWLKMLAAPVLTDPGAADEQDAYVAALRADLRTLWCNVIRRRAPRSCPRPWTQRPLPFRP